MKLKHFGWTGRAETDIRKAPVLMHDGCSDCAWRVSATSIPAIIAAWAEHADYINATADRMTDPHFADVRLTYLIDF